MSRCAVVRFVFVLLVLAVAGLLTCGCNVASAVAYVATPNPVVEAEYELQDVPTVVFVDDRRNRVNPVRFRRTIADVASEDLLAEELVTDVISPRDATAAARQLDRGAQAAGVGAVGKLVGADQVIYIEMLQFTLSRDGISPDPYARCRIRVIDVANRVRRFPAADKGDSDAYMLEISLPAEKSQGLTDSRTRQQLGEMLSDEIGRRVAQLFYDHEIPAVGGNLLFR
ncbi:MAG: hypothetical protein MK116_00930 [Phycisphaerales bacterium]|nr:hypothetical protein [Phycisphaerales bacterium]